MTNESMVEAALRRAREARQRRGIKTEMERILDLPRQDFMPGDNYVWKWTNAFARRPGKHCKFPLRPVQAAMLEECAWAANQDTPIGALFNVGVGKGKTLASLLIPEVFNAQRPLLLVPPSMRSQLEGDLFEWAGHYSFRLRYADVVYYSELSRPEATDLLRKRNPDLIICDEAHFLRHATAARTKRFLRYMQENPETRLVAMSGTLTGSTLSDYAHLAEIALREFSPLPRHDKEIALWGSVLNADGEPDDKAWQALAALDQLAADKRDVGRMRGAFRRRLSLTPGVVSTVSPSCDAVLELKSETPDLHPAVRQHINTLSEDYCLPNGDEIVDALHFHRALGQLSCGFYYVWDWPDDEVDEEWLDARRNWWGSCRQYLARYSREGCDSPFLVEEYVRKSGGPAELRKYLEEWDVQRHKDPPPTRAIWLDTGPVLHAIQWAAKRERAFIWYHSRAVGDMLEAFGIPTFRDGTETPDPELHPVAALSISVFNKGRNFQAWSDQLILEPPASAATWEQLLGRTHRQGQEAGTVKASIFQHTWANRQILDKAIKRARYIQDTTGQLQKLLMARRE